MKKIFACFIAIFISTGLFAQQPVVAVAPFDVISSAVTAEQASMINDVFFVRLGNTRRVGLVNRNLVDRILKEHSFQAGDWSNDNKTAELAKALNADWIVQGNIRKASNNLLIIIQFYDIKTFKFEGGTDIRLANVDEAYDKMDPLVESLIKTIADTGTRPPVARQPSGGTSNKDYNIGDFGPAGGIVFYDKGIFSNGWRYLEVAPVETEFRTQWGAYGKDISGTGTVVGSGKRNTELIIERLRQFGETGRAAQLCASLTFDGFMDWFLPSKDELDLLFKNKNLKRLGNFSDNGYWSSTQIDSNNALWQSFGNGSQNGYNNNGYKGANYFSVRAIRQF